MRALSNQDIVQTWEQGVCQGSAGRALAMLTKACPEQPAEELAALSIGRRDAALMTLRQLTFGSKLDGCADCPKCAAQLVFSVDTVNLTAQEPGTGPDFMVECEDLSIEVRAPDSRDLMAVERRGNAANVGEFLLRRCIKRAARAGTEVAFEELTPTVLERVERQIAEHDPQAEMLLALRCAACAHAWEAPLDIATFFWSEIANSARRLLSEVDRLARAYGWQEAQILALSAMRRQAYLELVG